jgi:hypothetical protein
VGLLETRLEVFLVNIVIGRDWFTKSLKKTGQVLTLKRSQASNIVVPGGEEEVGQTSSHVKVQM